MNYNSFSSPVHGGQSLYHTVDYYLGSTWSTVVPVISAISLGVLLPLI